jgi:glucose/arabinose dehydrogenase
MSVDTDAYPGGQHVVRARARDATGNVSPWAAATVRFVGGAAVPPGFLMSETFVAGLARSTAFAQAPDGRFFVCEQDGRLRVVKDGAPLATPFHAFSVDSTGERGLIGVVLDPDFAANGFVYVHYTVPGPGTHNRVSRLVAAGDVSTGAETVLVDLPALSGATNHNGGALRFGADGRLYVGVGDNADGAKAQDPAHPFGKLLRFERDGTIPADNPLCTTPGVPACAVWAMGLRNPFTFAVQPGTGRIHINDVGQSAWEEIDVGAPAANYGWPIVEGPGPAPAGVTAPLFAYGRSDANPPGSGPGGFLTGFAIAGGVFYPAGGTFPPSFHGNYVFGDFAARWLARLDAANDNAAYTFATLTGAPVDLLVGVDGALYVLEHEGRIARIAPR